ncbi:hypothetical protein LINPERPRIM_LOCUS15262 [Linum perenne]
MVFKELQSRRWDTSLKHVDREAHCWTDYLANLGHSLSIGLDMFSVPDQLLCSWLSYDLVALLAWLCRD